MTDKRYHMFLFYWHSSIRDAYEGLMTLHEGLIRAYERRKVVSGECFDTDANGLLVPVATLVHSKRTFRWLLTDGTTYRLSNDDAHRIINERLVAEPPVRYYRDENGLHEYEVGE